MYLPIEDVHLRSSQIRTCAQKLLSTKALVGRPKSKQWRFFRHLIRRLLDSAYPSEFEHLSSVQAAQLKFEVEDGLRRYYLRPGRSFDFVFSLVHRSKMDDQFLGDTGCYPELAGYCLLVRELAGDFIAGSTNSTEQRNYIERVVGEAVDSEFQAYQSLPKIDPEPLYAWFCTASPAIKEILNLLYRHREKGWIISNPLNPSTKRLMKIKVNRIGNQEASVSTMEYWYLRWWDSRKDTYVYPYRETNRQVYVLRREANTWKVYENQRPAPRTSVPHRRLNRRIKKGLS